MPSIWVGSSLKCYPPRIGRFDCRSDLSFGEENFFRLVQRNRWQHWYYSRTGCGGMGMCCEKMMMIGWRNARPRPRGRPKRTWREVVEKDCQAHKLNKEDAMDHRWRKLMNYVWWSGWVWVGECYFWYRPARVVLDKKLLNGCVCVCALACVCVVQRFEPS